MGKEIPESSKLEFLEKFSANNFVLSDEEDNTSRPLIRGAIAYLLKTLLATRQATPASNTKVTFEAQLLKLLRNTEAELKKSVTY